jgi:proline iminopeptidase
MRKTFRRALFASLLLSVPALLAASPARTAAAASAVYPIEEGYVDAHGVLIYYTTVGRGSPLVIVHGGPGASHDYFLPYLLPLARTNKLIFIDERGSGKSEKLEDVKQYTVENMASDVEDVRVALNLGKISLLGHSYGGVLAQAYAFKYPEHLSHLVLASTFASTKEMNQVLLRIKNQMPKEKLALATAFEKAGLYGKGAAWERGRYPSQYATLAWGDGYFPRLYGARPDPNYDPQAQNTSTAWDLYREMWGSHGEFVIDGNLASVEYLDRLPKIKIPTLVLAGDHDECDPSLAKEMQSKIAGSKLVILPNSGHMAFVDQPNLWNKSVAEFLNANERTTSERRKRR